MFFRQISDFEENFKFLDRLNDVLFNVWKDNNANAFKTQSINQLEMFYRKYVNEMRQKSNEMSTLLKEIEMNVSKLEKLQSQVSDLSTHPEIKGCKMCWATGRLSHQVSGGEYFIARPHENDYEGIANERCEQLYDIEKAFVEQVL